MLCLPGHDLWGSDVPPQSAFGEHEMEFPVGVEDLLAGEAHGDHCVQLPPGEPPGQ